MHERGAMSMRLEREYRLRAGTVLLGRGRFEEHFDDFIGWKVAAAWVQEGHVFRTPAIVSEIDDL